jgi:hypothetical protein
LIRTVEAGPDHESYATVFEQQSFSGDTLGVTIPQWLLQRADEVLEKLPQRLLRGRSVAAADS